MKRDQRGAISLLAPFIIVLVLFIGAVVFGVMIYQKEQKYKNHSDELVNAAVANAKQNQSSADAKQYAIEAKNPLTTFTGPSDFGSITIQYPKTWSAYVDEENSSGIPVNGYFNPGFVPSVSNPKNVFALRIEVTSNSYDNVLSQFNSLVHTGKVTVTPYQSSKIPNVIGVRIDGEVQQNKQGSMIILPLRNMTFEMWTESPQFVADFNNNILPNFSFSP